MAAKRTRFEKVCPVCSHIFLTIPSREKRSKLGTFCSFKCAMTFVGGERRKYPMKVGVCKNCKNDIIAKNSGFNKPWRTFCSKSCRMSWGNKGNKIWLGKHHKLESIEKLRIKKTGIPNYKNREIIGEKHWNWQGGKTKESIKIRNSAQYKDWRISVFKRDQHTCQECGKKQSKSILINADHIKPFALYPNFRFDVDNGRTLCVDCHKQTETYGYKASLLSMNRHLLTRTTC